MQRWTVIAIAAVAGLFIILGSVFTVRDSRQQALVDSQPRPDSGSNGNYRSLRFANAKERAAATTVIQNQLNAFKKHDFNTAMQLQSAPMRSRFRSSQDFGKMMLGNYADFCNFREVRFGRGRVDRDKSVWMRVRLKTQNGTDLHSMYQLVLEKGAFRVNSVMPSEHGGSGRGGAPSERAPHPRVSPQAKPQAPAIGV